LTPLDRDRQDLSMHATASRTTFVALSLFPLSVLALGCGSDPDPTVTSTPEGTQYSFDTSTYSLKPSEEVRYLCFTTRLPKDVETVITEITPKYGRAIHHLGIYQTLAPEPDGAFDCPQLVRETWLPLYGGGVESGTLKLPEGTGFHLPKGQQVLVQLHLLNATAQTVEDKATIVFKTADPAKTLTRAGMFGFDDRDLQIPPHTNDVEQVLDCPDVGVDMNVFAVFGHMHTMGKHIELSRGPQAGAEVLYQADWNFDEQPPLPAPVHIAPTADLHLRCRYDNPTDNTVTYGESTYNEMCSFVFYYTPFESLNGCLKTPPPMP
jgi:hypothetical protein